MWQDNGKNLGVYRIVAIKIFNSQIYGVGASCEEMFVQGYLILWLLSEEIENC